MIVNGDAPNTNHAIIWCGLRPDKSLPVDGLKGMTAAVYAARN